MTVSYQKVWETMNEVESVTSKICSAREILDCAIDAHQEHKYEKVEHFCMLLMNTFNIILKSLMLSLRMPGKQL